MEYDSILIGPVLTEKSNVAREIGHYAFKVDPRADKRQIMEAVRRMFNVNPVSCNIINVKSKPKRLRNRPGKTATWKKAIVRLQPGEKIADLRGRLSVRGKYGYQDFQADHAGPQAPRAGGEHRDHRQPEQSREVPYRGKKSNGGRASNGRISVRHQGGGHKQKYRVIDFKRDKAGVPGVVASIEYDPNRSANIALINYVDGEKRYILSPKGLAVGKKVIAGRGRPIEPGNSLPLEAIPIGITVHNVELTLGKGGQLARSAGAARPDRGEGGRLRRPQAPLGRAPHGVQEVLGDHRLRRQRGAYERAPGQGGQDPLARSPPHRARYRHESGRSPARRRRGTRQGLQAARVPVGPAGEGLQDARHAQAVQPLHRQAQEVR